MLYRGNNSSRCSINSDTAASKSFKPFKNGSNINGSNISGSNINGSNINGINEHMTDMFFLSDRPFLKG